MCIRGKFVHYESRSRDHSGSEVTFKLHGVLYIVSAVGTVHRSVKCGIYWTDMDCDARAPTLGAADTSTGDEEAAYKPDVDGGDGHLCWLLASSQRHPSYTRLL